MSRNLNDKMPRAANFQYKEFIKSDIAARYNLPNIPIDSQWEKIEVLAANILQPVREKFGRIRITSGFRAPEVNKKLGSWKYSNHIKGEAADIEPIEYNVSLMDILTYIAENLEFRTIILEYPPLGWVHVDYRAGSNIKKIKLRDRNHYYTTVKLKYIQDLYS